MPRPREPRSCACGCGTVFLPWTPSKRYVHPSHTTRTRGWAHQKAAKALLARSPNGRPCPRCGEPMTNEQWRRKQLDAGHTYDLALLGGVKATPDRVEHSWCNRSAGTRLGNALARGRHPIPPFRDW